MIVQYCCSLSVDFGKISPDTLEESLSGKQSQNNQPSNLLDYGDDSGQSKTYIPESESESSEEEKTRRKKKQINCKTKTHSKIYSRKIMCCMQLSKMMCCILP